MVGGAPKASIRSVCAAVLCERRINVEKLAEYFLEHLVLDMDGALDLEELREMVADTPDGAELMKHLETEDDLEEFIITLVDGLKDRLVEGIRKETILEELDAILDS